MLPARMSFVKFGMDTGAVLIRKKQKGEAGGPLPLFCGFVRFGYEWAGVGTVVVCFFRSDRGGNWFNRNWARTVELDVTRSGH